MLLSTGKLRVDGGRLMVILHKSPVETRFEMEAN